MPQRQTLITWTALNLANFTSPTGQTDSRTGLPLQVGGINQGDYFDLTQAEALGLSSLPVGRLYAGRYRLVQVDPNATTANVAQGTLAAYAPGPSVEGVSLLTGGSGQTPGMYNVAASGGGGTGAVLQVAVNQQGVVLQAPTILNPGAGYTSTPTFTLAAGGTPATFVAQMTGRFNVVTSFDKAVSIGLPRAVFLNAISPGNYGFVQELGLATVLGNATIGSQTLGALLSGAAGGTVTAAAPTTSPTGATFARAFDLPQASALFRAELDLPVVQG